MNLKNDDKKNSKRSSVFKDCVSLNSLCFNPNASYSRIAVPFHVPAQVGLHHIHSLFYAISNGKWETKELHGDGDHGIPAVTAVNPR